MSRRNTRRVEVEQEFNIIDLLDRMKVLWEEPKNNKQIPIMTKPQIIEKMINEIVNHHLKLKRQNWLDVELSDPKMKFQILKDCSLATKKRVPNLELNNIRTTKDVLDFFVKKEQPDPRTIHPVADWFMNQDKLPPNINFVPYFKQLGEKRFDRVKLQKKIKG
ncbi:14352_t:CDS:2 [Entrophospora sp. SA101]|nr:6022_t:CDS:2 [Entrophospora sp. SA101]CAJ0756775.1 6707_t:CDS:2 [Entrophospora sp. SA101]CAJ0766846.1 14352_t:CDS:2 [Entrophospora sp. SA101]CAJ0840995.1 17168_t:CDS:2 [Entrophospora sp. SA101]CAJ0909379.1 15360_t:CDS:2 [Entrophospora sp. SA101]